MKKRAKIGETIEFTDGTRGKITQISIGDFIGEPRLLTVQCIEHGPVKHIHISEDKLIGGAA